MSSAGYTPYEPQLVPVSFAKDIWTVDGPEVRYVLAGMPLPCPTRMTIVRLPGGRLWLHSPVTWSAELENSLAKLGEAAIIVAPNSYHHLHVAAWTRACPQAEVHASPDLPARLPYAATWRPLSSTPHSSWEPVIEQQLVDLGRFKEVVFFHRSSSTLIVTDLMQNFEEGRVKGLLTRALLRLGGATGPVGTASIEIRLAALANKDALCSAVRRMLGWQPQRIILAHGRPYSKNGKAELRKAFAWAGAESTKRFP